MKSLISQIIRVSAGLALILAAAVTAAPAAEGEETPQEIRKGIEAALRQKVEGLLAEKNESGQTYRRGTYSRHFKKLDEETYQAAFQVDTVVKANLKTERYLLTLARDAASGGWSIRSEDLQDSYSGLFRGVPGDEDCFGFEAFQLSTEGLRISAGRGSACKDYLNGKLSRIGLTGADLAYQYEPPMEQDRDLWRILTRDKAQDLLFPPDTVGLDCDPSTCEQLLASGFTGTKPVKREEIDASLARQIDKFAQDAEKAVRENPFAGFRKPDEPDRRRLTIAIKKKMSDQLIGLTSDNYEPREVTFWAEGFGAIYSYYSETTRKAGSPAIDLERRPDSEGAYYDLKSLVGTVELGLADAELLTGDITYGLTTRRSLREIPFAISRLREPRGDRSESKNPTLTINALEDGEGRALTFVRTGPISGLIILPAEVQPGTDLTFRLQFANRDSLYKLTPSFSYVDRLGWLPLVRFGDMIHTFDLTVKVPDRYTTLGIGRKTAESRAGGVSTTRWVADKPVDFPTVIYGIYESDTADVKATKKDGTEIPVKVYFDKDSLAQYRVPLKALRKFANDAANSLNFYREVYGIDYPYSKLDLVNDPQPAFYGQAPSSIIYLGSLTFLGKGTLATFAEGARSADDLPRFVDSLVAHEVAHQWWGALIANSNFRNYWFVESLAEFSSALFVESAYGPKAYADHIDEWRRNVMANDLRSSVQDASVLWSGSGFRTYQANVYNKGPYVFHIMRTTWGDEAMKKFLKLLASELQGREIVTRDIQRVAEKAFGANLDWFFDQWIRGVGLPQFTFTYTFRKAEDGTQIVEGEVEQRIVLKHPSQSKEILDGKIFKGIAPITIVGKSGKEYRKRLIIETEKTPFKFNVPEEPKEIFFNKHGELLALDIQVKERS